MGNDCGIPSGFLAMCLVLLPLSRSRALFQNSSMASHVQETLTPCGLGGVNSAARRKMVRFPKVCLVTCLQSTALRLNSVGWLTVHMNFQAIRRSEAEMS